MNEKILLDDFTLTKRALHLPESMRLGFAWLGAYLREDCMRDIDILASRMKDAGVNHDKTTWSRVLRGRWDRDGFGNPTPPIISEEKFLRAVDLLRKHEERRQMAGRVPFVPTSTAKTVLNLIELKRAPEMVCKFGVVVGETGSGKTATFIEYRRQYPTSVAVIEAPAMPTMTMFLSDLAASYGCSRVLSYSRKISAITLAVDRSKVIIVDNVQRLFQPKMEGNQPIFNFLQKLQEDSGCTIILSFTPTFERTFTEGTSRGYFEQFEGRAGGRRNFLRLPPYPPESDVVQIAEAFGIRDAAEHVEYLVRISREPGRIRRLFDDLQAARRKAEREKKALCIEHVRWARDEEE